MKKMHILIEVFCLLAIVSILFSIATIRVFASEPKDMQGIDLISMEATAYCYGTTRCDGGKVRTGICATDAKHYGMTACIYEQNDDGSIGDLIGIYECLDTGGERIRKGEVIDIYNPSYDWCVNFGRKKVYVIFVDAKG